MNKSLWTLLLLAAALAAGPAAAQERKSFREAGLWISYADAFRVTDVEDPRHEYMFIAPRYGLPFPWGDHGDRFGLIVEPHLGFFLRPRQAFGGGANLLFNWRPWGTSGDWIPFGELGGGVFLTEYSRLDGFLNFELQFGAGVHRRLKGPWALSAAYRFHHFSNGGIYKPNIGINAHMAMLGLSWLP